METMEPRYFSDMLAALANRASLGTVSWLGFANAPLRRHLMEVFSRPYGDTGNFLADPTFEAVFGWAPGPVKMGDLAGNLLTSALVDAMDKPPSDVHGEYRFAKDRVPYAHQLAAWRILSQQPAQSVVVTSGTSSGKTECFMVPILDRLAREQAKGGGQLVGVRALFLYPLNALINSQRDRLRAWTSGFGRNVRFCLYNGVTPDSVPAGEAAKVICEVLDRRTLRASPPPILVTNATMLEYMLVRTQDANILQASLGKLEWIVLDEAHTYVGSQAAELALLIRRVIHAFGVHPENVRFIATSATIGDPDGAGGEGLRGFLAQIAGVDIAQVHVVSGARQVPLLPTINHVRSDSIADLCLLDAEIGTTSGRYQGLVNHGTARKIRDLFVNRKTSPVARLSEVCSVAFGPAPAYTLDQQQQALDWLDRLEELAFMPMDRAWICPVSRRFLDTTLRGITPYLPKQATEAMAMCEAIEIPIYDAPFGNSTDGAERLRHARAWISAQHALTRLREEGLWSNLNDRVIELAPYFATAEHSAQQSSKLLGQYEKRFKDGQINLLSCSTTMELGIDTGWRRYRAPFRSSSRRHILMRYLRLIGFRSPALPTIRTSLFTPFHRCPVQAMLGSLPTW